MSPELAFGDLYAQHPTGPSKFLAVACTASESENQTGKAAGWGDLLAA
jgi:hypothetical protein